MCQFEMEIGFTNKTMQQLFEDTVFSNHLNNPLLKLLSQLKSQTDNDIELNIVLSAIGCPHLKDSQFSCVKMPHSFALIRQLSAMPR